MTDMLQLNQVQIDHISNQVGYYRNMNTKSLYQKVGALTCSLEDKVKFIWWHWGWSEEVKKGANEVIKDIENANFTIPNNIKTIFQQFWGLNIPIKNVFHEGGESFVDLGGLIKFNFDGFSWKDMIVNAEMLGVKFRETILPIGIRRNYNGYSSNSLDDWENPDYESYGWGCDELYMGASGKIYGIADVEYGGFIEIEAENIVDFFAASFEFIPVTVQELNYKEDEECTIIEKIEELMQRGEYKQNCLWAQ